MNRSKKSKKSVTKMKSSVTKFKINDKKSSNYRRYEEPIGNTVYQFTVKDLKDESVSMSRYAGLPFMVVNIASSDSMLTGKNLIDLNRLYLNYGQYGFQIAAFPTNDFGCEPLDDKGIVDFIEKHEIKYHVYARIEICGKCKY